MTISDDRRWPGPRARGDGIRSVEVCAVLASTRLRAVLHPADALAWRYDHPDMFEEYAELNTARGYTVHGPFPGPGRSVIGVVDLRGVAGWAGTDPAQPDDAAAS